MASDTVLMQVEGLVSNRRDNQVPGADRSAGLPGECGHAGELRVPPDFVPQILQLRRCAPSPLPERGSQRTGFAAYMKQFVLEPATQDEYMRRVQNQEWIGEF